MPISPDYKARLYPILPDVAAHFGTPFHIYDERGIQESMQRLTGAFDGLNFREFYAVKALPNPHILSVLKAVGGTACGFDCSSIAELILARTVGAQADEIMFTSNNTSQAEFTAALGHGGCIVNLDDISLIDKVPQMPELICFRYNPGERRSGNTIIGNPAESKFGVSHEQIVAAYERAQARGAKRFGLHTMIVSNERDYRSMVMTATMLLELVETLSPVLDAPFDFINIGGGLGIPYRPEESPLDLDALSAELHALLMDFEARHGWRPALYMESGRYVTGPHGVLVTKAINHKDTYRKYIGVDTSMSALMRPGMYGAYHYIDVVGKDEAMPSETVDVVGALCENNDKFAVQRQLPCIEDGDLLVIHDTGAHSHSMGFNYNGRLRPQELLLRNDGRVERVRRAETLKDYFATLDFTPDSRAFS
jgi:diaminopimelate decarboxylase